MEVAEYLTAFFIFLSSLFIFGFDIWFAFIMKVSSMNYLGSVCVGFSACLEFSLFFFYFYFISFFYVILVELVDYFIKVLRSYSEISLCFIFFFMCLCLV